MTPASILRGAGLVFGQNFSPQDACRAPATSTHNEDLGIIADLSHSGRTRTCRGVRHETRQQGDSVRGEGDAPELRWKAEEERESLRCVVPEPRGGGVLAAQFGHSKVAEGRQDRSSAAA